MSELGIKSANRYSKNGVSLAKPSNIIVSENVKGGEIIRFHKWSRDSGGGDRHSKKSETDDENAFPCSIVK